MKLVINTEVLKSMVSKVEKGASNNKLLPVTGFLGIKYVDGTLSLTTTDATNYVCATEKLSEQSADEIDISVYVDKFSKLIARMTCDLVYLEVVENYLEITGNGKYKIELPYDEVGNVVKFPNPQSKLNADVVETGEVGTALIKQIINSVRPSLAVTPEVPCYMNYYLADKVIGTDTYTIAGLNMKVFESPRLISAELMNLLTVTSGVKYAYTIYANGAIKFVADDCEIIGKCADGLAEYAIGPISKLLELDVNSKCEISKDEILQLLDRITLFVHPYDKNGVRLTFTEDALLVESYSVSGAERIEYQSASNVAPATYMIDVEVLQAQIKASLGNNVEMYWGDSSAIKLSSGNLTQILALLNEVQ